MQNAMLEFIPSSLLRGANLFTAKDDDDREYLKGVVVERINGTTRVVATDSHSLFVARVSTKTENFGSDFRILIPNEMLKRIKASKLASLTLIITPNSSDSKKIKPLGTRDLMDADLALTNPSDMMTLSGASAGGEYPDWRRILPHRFSGEVGQLSHWKLDQLSKLAREITNVKPPSPAYSLTYNGPEGVAMALFEGDYEVCVFISPTVYYKDDNLELLHARALEIVGENVKSKKDFGLVPKRKSSSRSSTPAYAA